MKTARDWRDKKLQDIPQLYRQKIETELRTQSKDYIRKLEVIKNSIFGVDIQPIAVEVSRLRAFLTLIVEEEIDDSRPNRGIEPLPNLEFKFVCANSLIPAPERTDAGKLFKDTFQEDLKIKIDKYFSATGSEKTMHLNDIRNLIDFKVKKQLKTIEGMFRHDDEVMQKARAQQNKKAITTQSRIMTLWESYKNLFSNKPVDFFEAEYFFPSVEHGFDIVIGNPPYVSLEKIGNIKNEYKKIYEVADGRADLYCLFYEMGMRIAKKQTGLLCYITSNKWMRAGYGSKLRGFFAEHSPLKLIDFGGFKVFQSATVDTNILLIKNQEQDAAAPCYACHFKNDYQKGDEIADYFQKNKLPLTQLGADTWFIGSQAQRSLKQKIEADGHAAKRMGCEA